MSNLRGHSSPELFADPPDDCSLEGITANVKLLLKLIQDHGEACSSKSDDRKDQRVAGMMTILDNVKTRIQKSQPNAEKRQKAELRRCSTDLRPRNNIPKDKKAGEPSATTAMDDKQRLQRELKESASNRKSLEVMCQSLGKEKTIMAGELARKVQELGGMEELINDLRTQNESLMGKVQACKAEHKERPQASSPPQPQGSTTALQERNKTLSEQLLKSLDAYRALKRKYKDTVEEATRIRATVEELKAEVATGLRRIRTFQPRTEAGTQQGMEIEETLTLERLFERFEMIISKHGQRKAECVKQKADVNLNSSKPPVLA